MQIKVIYRNDLRFLIKKLTKCLPKEDDEEDGEKRRKNKKRPQNVFLSLSFFVKRKKET